VILIDADVAKSYLTEAFGLRDRPGLTEYLSNPALDIADVLVATNNERLFILPAGKFFPHVSELFSGARMQQLLRELTETGPNTLVLVDSSPVLATNEAQVLARLVPQILVVIRAEHTPQPVVLEACDLLGREKLSAVLNQAHGGSVGEAYGAAYGSYGNE
jgi:Mrp family chromosome partitioning ATPase